mmetsp:Transcript_45041/g.97833  ORF Transcript_45041/g.97833 Transcript_45041/m.97833 type:complete len:289 (-) Transcript_45041:99-965(-)
MELAELEFGFKHVSSSGHTLNVQEIAGLTVGLSKLKHNEKFRKIFFWGKIFGTIKDYYVAYGLRESEFEFPVKKFFIATGPQLDLKAIGETFEFTEMMEIPAEDAEKLTNEITTPFLGNPQQQLLPVPTDAEAEEGEPVKEEKKLFESDRLSMTVMKIDRDTAVVPRGSQMLDERHLIVPNKSFRGLTYDEAKSLEAFQHFRAPSDLPRLRAIARDDAQFNPDCLDSIHRDAPKGCWAVRMDASASVVTMRSLLWMGYTSYHVLNTTFFGGVYIGDGQKNGELPFILP